MSHIAKIIDKSERSKMLYQCTWRVEQSVTFEELNICERAVVTAPEGRVLTFLVNGVVRDIKPGKYYGKVQFVLSEPYDTRPSGLMAVNQISSRLRSTVCVENGTVTEKKCIPDALLRGSYDDKKAEKLHISSSAESFTGVVVDGGAYEIRDSKFDLYGNAYNDYAGEGACVLAAGDSEVTIADSKMTLSGVTRCAVHVGGNSRVKVENCDITNISPASDWLGRFSWQLPLRGTNRLCQLCDNGQVVYDNCRLKSNGWGVLSIDGSDEFVKMTVKNSRLELSGPDTYGYGAFCIGPAEVTFDHTEVDVDGMPMLVMGMFKQGKAEILNGSRLTGRHFGVEIIMDDSSVVTIKDSVVDTGDANIVVKGSTTTINAENCEMKSGAGVLLRMMDSECASMDMVKYCIPVGVVDEAIPGRDLVRVDPMKDVTLNLADMEVSGDIYNSTTNIRAGANAVTGGMGRFHDTLIGPVPFNNPMGEAEPGEAGEPFDPEGPRNLGVHLRNVKYSGIISAAVQAYRDGIDTIEPCNYFDLSMVKQTAAPPVNNGVSVTLDSGSVWTVEGTSYLTALTIAEGAELIGADGKHLRMTVDEVETELKAGHYEGKIVISML